LVVNLQDFDKKTRINTKMYALNHKMLQIYEN